jgi:hypothetical protein
LPSSLAWVAGRSSALPGLNRRFGSRQCSRVGAPFATARDAQLSFAGDGVDSRRCTGHIEVERKLWVLRLEPAGRSSDGRLHRLEAGVMIEALVRAAIDTTSDEAAKPRLRRCVPPLVVAVKNWGGSPAGEVVMAAATPKAAFMFVADDWPDIDEGEFQTHEVARALVAAIESSAANKSDVILGATSALLGEAGLDAQRAEQERIADTGAVPLVVTLVEHDGKSVALMVTWQAS